MKEETENHKKESGFLKRFYFHYVINFREESSIGQDKSPGFHFTNNNAYIQSLLFMNPISTVWVMEP